jgi:arylsulfatase A-like enzyme
LLLSVWFGILTGLVEGASLFLFQELRWSTWNMSLVSVSIEIIWISVFFDVVLFALMGMALAMGSRVLGRLPWTRITVFICLFWMFLDWMLIIGRIRMTALAVLAAGLAAAGVRLFVAREQKALLFWRRSLRWVLPIPLVAFVAIQGGLWAKERIQVARLPDAPPNAPNVIVIILDALRADHLSGLGYFRGTTPNLDRLAKQGVSFEHGISTSSWSLPSHASFLTGAYPFEHGAEDDYFDRDLPTIAKVLRDRGYRTGAVSANPIFFSRRVGFGRGFIHFDENFWSVPDMVSRTMYGRKLETLLLPKLGIPNRLGRRWAPDVNRSALKWIEQDRARPFLLYLNYIDVHEPFVPPQPFRGKFSDIPNPGGYINWWFSGNRPKLTPEQLRHEIEAHDGALAFLDLHIGKLMEELDRRGVTKNTVVIIMSDHGQPLGDHGYYLHGFAPYMSLLRVPLIILHPDKVPAGASITRPVSIASVPATILEMAGLPPAPSFSAESLVPLWKSPGSEKDWPWPLAEKGLMTDETRVKSIVGPRWHYIERENGKLDLYDWAKDPKELNNLAKAPEYADVLRQMQTYLKRLLAERGRAKMPADVEPHQSSAARPSKE